MIKEYDGKTEEEAVRKAMAELNVKDFEYELLEDSKKSFFKKPLVKIRVYLDEEKNPLKFDTPKDEKKDYSKDVLEDVLVDVPPYEAPTTDEAWVLSFLKDLAKMVGLELEPRVSQRSTSGKHYIEIKSNDEALIIGNQGERLDAFQAIVSAAYYKNNPESEDRFILDVDGYKRDKIETILKNVRKIAKTVQETGKSYLLEPLNAYERREVHKLINNYEGLSSESEGYNNNSKRVRIFKVS